MKTPLLVDTHVHLHAEFAVPAFLSAAVFNLTGIASGLGAPDAEPGLCFADMPGQDSLGRLEAESEGWTTEREGVSLRLTRESDGKVLTALAGHQFVSSEELEVLALGCRMDLPESSLTVLELIEAIKVAGGVPVLPWGVGKWTGSRASVVQSLSGGRSDVRFADNGNRLKNSPVPATLRYAQDHQGCPLAGSDPLPLESHETRVGSYASFWKLDQEGSFEQRLRAALTEKLPVSWVGELTSPVQFVFDQLIMQRNKHLPWLKR